MGLWGSLVSFADGVRATRVRILAAPIDYTSLYVGVVG